MEGENLRRAAFFARHTLYALRMNTRSVARHAFMAMRACAPLPLPPLRALLPQR